MNGESNETGCQLVAQEDKKYECVCELRYERNESLEMYIALQWGETKNYEKDVPLVLTVEEVGNWMMTTISIAKLSES